MCARPSPARWVSIERAHNTRKGHAASVRRQSRQRLRCVRPYRCMTNATESTAAFAALRTAKQPASPGGKSSDAGRAAVGAYSKAKDGGTLSRYYLLCENHRRRDHQVSGASRGELCRAAADAYSKAKDGGYALKIPSTKREPPPPRPKHQAKIPHQSTEAAPRLGGS